jgi:hypothetical protein
MGVGVHRAGNALLFTFCISPIGSMQLLYACALVSIPAERAFDHGD